jgi:hypothetical protein
VSVGRWTAAIQYPAISRPRPGADELERDLEAFLDVGDEVVHPVDLDVLVGGG